MIHVYVPLEILTASNVNISLAGKADLDAVTGKVIASQLPDLVAIAQQGVAPTIASIEAEIAVVRTSAATASTTATAAQTTAATAQTAATAAQTTATTAQTTATTAQATATAAIPLTAEGVTVATLGADGLLTSSQRPPAPASSGGGPVAWVNYDGLNGVIRASKNISSVTKNNGIYQFFFTTPMPNTNYCAVFGGKFGDDFSDATVAIVSEVRATNSRTTTSITVVSAYQNAPTSGTGFAIHTVSMAIFM